MTYTPKDKNGVIKCDAFKDWELADHPDRERIEATVFEAESNHDPLATYDNEELIEHVYNLPQKEVAEYLFHNGGLQEAREWLEGVSEFIEDMAK